MCIKSVYLTALWLLATHAGVLAQSTDAADALYARRDDPVAARRAAEAYQARHRREPQDFVGAWKLARAGYFLGTHGPEPDRRTWLEVGVQASDDAIRLNEARPEGHFWLAANMGALAESFGLRQGLKYRARIKTALERVLAIDPAYLNGSADRALGRWYHKVPGLFGGSTDKAVEHLRRSLSHDPESTATMYFLAEVYLDTGDSTQGRNFLQRVLDAPPSPDWGPEDQAFKAEARRRLAEGPRR
ncbi:MAG: tetratricopeptide repeat protein [Luteitalea sp.]